MAFGPTIEQRFPTSMTAPAPTPAMRIDSIGVREAVVDAARAVDEAVPDGRWKSLALTALEEALMWANKGLFNEPRPDDLEPDGE